MGAMEDPGSRPVHSLIYGSGSLEPFWVSVSPSIKKKKKKSDQVIPTSQDCMSSEMLGCLWGLNTVVSWAVMAHTFDPSTQEAEAGGSLSSRPTWATE